MTLGVRVLAAPRTYVQGTVGAAYNSYDNGGFHEQWWSPVGMVALGWRRPITDAVLGFELRATVLRHDETLVTSAAAVVSGGYAW